jgi:hypothetical protein
MQGGQSESTSSGTNAQNGVLVRYYLKNKGSKEINLQFLNEINDTIISYSSTKDLKGEPMKIAKEFHQDANKTQAGFITAKAGMNSFNWNMRYPSVTKVEGTNVMWAGSGVGPKVVPGNYKVRLIEDGKIIGEQPIEIKKDPRLTVSDADLAAQFDLHKKINKKVDEAHIAINKIRKIRTQINSYVGSVKDTLVVNQMKKITKPILESIDEIESTLMQPKAIAPQDVLAFPIMLNDKMAGLGSNVSSAETKPIKSAYIVYEDLAAKIDKAVAKVKDITDIKIAEFNEFVKSKQIPAILLDKEKK